MTRSHAIKQPLHRCLTHLLPAYPRSLLVAFYSKVTAGCERCLVAHYEYGAVGVANDGVGDAAHQSPAHRAKTPAAHHYQGRADLLAQADDLLVGFPGPEVALRHLRAFRPQLLGPPFEELLGLAPRLL